MPPRETEPESTLLCRARDGDREAFAALVLQHRREALQVALGFVGDLEDARDLTQEAFLRALAHMHRFDVERPFFPWFYRILRNLCFNFIAKRGRHGECPLVLESDGGIDPAGPTANSSRAKPPSWRRPSPSIPRCAASCSGWRRSAASWGAIASRTPRTQCSRAWRAA